MNLASNLKAAVCLIGLAGTWASAADGRPGRYETMDYGPVIADTVRTDWPEENLVRKGLAIRLDHESAMVFDTDLLRFAAGTTGGWLDLDGTNRTRNRGNHPPAIEGRQVFGTAERAGWAREGRFDGPREDGFGNLPHDWAHYKGFYRYGDEVVLEYTVGDVTVLESPRAIDFGGESPAFVRRFRVEASADSMAAYLVEPFDDAEPAWRSDEAMLIRNGEGFLVVALGAGPEGALVKTGESGGVELHLPPGDGSREFSVVVAELAQAGEAAVEDALRRIGRELRPFDFENARAGGPARWDEELPADAEVAENDAGYVVDSIGLPEENPWGAWLRPTGLDFFEDGTRAALGTWNGDVWIVSGLDETLENVRWRRFASGLYGAMGIAVVDGEIHVTEYGQLTRLRDLNGNGEADFYENVNNDGVVYPRAHSLTLEVDSEGNFYFFKNGNRVPEGFPQHGALIRVSPDGREREVFATGIRGANSMGIGPDDTILSADQQGNWVPVDRVDRLRRGGFYGYRPHGGENVPPGEFETPVFWIPHGVNGSTGALHFAGNPEWGPLHGNWVLGSYTHKVIFLVLTEELGEVMQGGLVAFPWEFDSGLVRARTSPRDGQLYVAGLRGWGTAAREDASFDRVRYTGGPVYLPNAFNVTPEGVRLTFSETLDRSVAEDPARYEVERWEYIYSEDYGSPEMSVSDPQREGRDPVEVASASLSDDGKTVFLEIPDILPVMQQKVAYSLRFEDGREVDNAIYHTIHVLSEDDVPERRVRMQTEARERVAERHRDKDAAGDAPVWFEQGRESFEMNCRTCHQAGGVAPAMEDSDWAGASEEVLTRIVLNGMEGSRGLMTSFDWMDDEEISAVLSYIRTRWHGEEPVGPDTVARIRRETEDRADFWTPEELRALEE